MSNHNTLSAAPNITTEIYTGSSPFDNPVDGTYPINSFQQVSALEQTNANPENERGGGWLKRLRCSMGRSAETLVNLPKSEKPTIQTEINDPFGITSSVYEAPNPFGADQPMSNFSMPTYEASSVDAPSVPLASSSQEQLNFRSRFAAGGEVSRTVESKAELASRLIERAQQALNHKAARRLPFVGKYVDAANSVVGVAHTVADVAGNYNTVAGNVQGMYEQRNDLAGAATTAAKEAVRDVAGAAGSAAAKEVGRQVGITYENNKLKVNVFKLGGAALKVFKNPVGFVGNTLKGAGRAAAEGAQSRAGDRLNGAVTSARSAATSMYETSMF